MHIYTISVAQTRVTAYIGASGHTHAPRCAMGTFKPIWMTRSWFTEGTSENGLPVLKRLRGNSQGLKVWRYSSAAVSREYSKNGAKVCKGRSSKIDRFLRCQLLSTPNFSHFQSWWRCRTLRWRKDFDPIKWKRIRFWGSIKICC